MVRSFACSALLVALVAGCASGSSSSSNSADITSADLSAKTVVKGLVATGQTLAVDYEPAEYAVNGLPYLGVTFAATAADTAATANANATPATRSITITGNFPGTPHVLVVDPSFAILAEADGVRTVDGAQAKLSLPAETLAGKNMLLIQDPRWNAPMSFDVTAE